MSDGFFSSNFMPHGHCYYWRPDILWTTVVADVTIALSYFAIPIAILVMVKRHPELRLNGVLVLFAAFIFGCGSVHLVEIWNIWHAYYGVQATMKAGTAAISLFTAIVVWRMIPLIEQICGPSGIAERVKQATAGLTRDKATLEDSNAELSGQVGSLVGELRDRNQELVERTKLLEQSNEELQQFAYIASHDLQSPLRNISGFVQLLQRHCGDQLDDKARDWMERTVSSSQHMQRLIDDLLTFSRVESRGQDFAAVDLNAVVNDAKALLTATIEDTGIEVIVSNELPTIYGDKTQMTQVVCNLIDNAAKYRFDKPPRIEFSASEADGKYSVVAADNGLGIDGKHHRNIFEIFRRLHTQEEYPGTGIGLAVVQRVLRRHDGDVRLESSLGNGCRFILEFPVWSMSHESPAQRAVG